MQKRVYERIGVRVDQILQSHGTTNTGNVARRCFDNTQGFAEALNLDPQFVNNLASILLLFKSRMHLNLQKLRQFTKETYKMNYELYPWSRMSPSVHKLLEHGCDIAEQFPLPMIYFSEDALESWHKYYRRNMTSHARQHNRTCRILDVFNRAIYLSDPKISMILIDNRQKQKATEVPASLNEFLQERLKHFRKT